MPKPNDKIGDYTLKSKIGRGAFGVVWLAEKEGLIKTDFALKIPNEFDVDLALVEREAVLWKKASGHQNVLPIIEAKLYDEQVVIVSEYVSGGTLQDLIDKLKADNQLLDTEKSVELISGILSGLQHLHSKNIIHQDLKPANILLQGETPRLTDFGISGTLSSKSYMPGTLGTFPYMSPETFKGRRSYQTDIWAVGVIFYQLLSGNLPFPQEDSPSVMFAVINDEVPLLPESVSKPLRNIVEKALQKNTEQRFKSASEMRQAVREVQFPVLPLPTEPATPHIIKTLPMPRPDVPPINFDSQEEIFPEPKRRKSKVWLWSIGSIALVVVMAAGIFAIRSYRKSYSTNPVYVALRDTKLHDSPITGANNVIGLVTKNSQVHILDSKIYEFDNRNDSKDNWYQISIIKQGRISPNTGEFGWVSAEFIVEQNSANATQTNSSNINNQNKLPNETMNTNLSVNPNSSANSNIITNANLSTNFNTISNANVSPSLPIDVTGTWNIIVREKGNNYLEFKVRFRQMGEKFRVEQEYDNIETEDEDDTEWLRQKDGKINIDKITFNVGLSDGDFILTGTVIKKTMSGTILNGRGNWTAKRQ